MQKSNPESLETVIPHSTVPGNPIQRITSSSRPWTSPPCVWTCLVLLSRAPWQVSARESLVPAIAHSGSSLRLAWLLARRNFRSETHCIWSAYVRGEEAQ